MEIQRFSIHVFYLPLCLLGAPPHREPASDPSSRVVRRDFTRERKDNNKKVSASAPLKEFIKLPSIKCLMLITFLISDIYFYARATTGPYSVVMISNSSVILAKASREEKGKHHFH